MCCQNKVTCFWQRLSLGMSKYSPPPQTNEKGNNNITFEDIVFEETEFPCLKNFLPFHLKIISKTVCIYNIHAFLGWIIDWHCNILHCILANWKNWKSCVKSSWGEEMKMIKQEICFSFISNVRLIFWHNNQLIIPTSILSLESKICRWRGLDFSQNVLYMFFFKADF